MLDRRKRLATLAWFWNRSKRSERLTIFHKFLSMIKAEGTVADTFTTEHMNRLPLDNYVDLTIPTQWIEFYQALPTDTKVDLYVDVWGTCDEEERKLIVTDLHYFFIDSKAK